MGLTPVQMRILGSLMEKERTTPDTYPLTLNSLLLACNQSTNRHPVVHLDDKTVGNALLNLRGLNLVRIVHSRSNRAEKYRQVLDEALGLDGAEAAVLCVLVLRGPQTPGELRARTERLHSFADQEEVDEALGRLARRPEPLVARLERQPGQKEARWAQLVGGELPPTGEVAAPAGSQSASGSRDDPGFRDDPGLPDDPGFRDDPGLPDDSGFRDTSGQDGLGGPAPAHTGGHDTADRVAALEIALAAVRDDLDRLRADYDELAQELR